VPLPRLLLTLGLWLLALLLAGCEGETAKPSARPATAQPHLVELAEARVQALGEPITHTGTLRARRSLRVFTQEEGRITALEHFEGDRVEPGEVLLRLDDALLRAQLDKTEAGRHQAELDLRRLSSLVGRKAVAEEEVARARTALEVAQAESALLRTRIGYTVERAPFAGVVSERRAEPGDVVARHTHVLTLIDPQSLVTEIPVSELFLARLGPGDPAEVRIDALGTGTFRGRVLRIHPALDPTTRQGLVEVALDPVPPGAAAGQFCRVTLATANREQLAIPLAALRRDRAGEHVFRVDPDDAVRRVAVDTGSRLAEQVEILQGLAAGDRVVVRGFLGLREGATARVVTHGP
jgi:membrane fusion protein (multidrug efflux system)